MDRIHKKQHINIIDLSNTQNIFNNKTMENIELRISKDDQLHYKEAAEMFDVRVVFSQQNTRVFIEAIEMHTICKVCVMAGYFKSDEMHRKLNAKYRK